MPNPKRILLTFATGGDQYFTMAKALGASAKYHGCTAKRVIFTDRPNDPDLKKYWDECLPVPEGFDHWFIKLAGLVGTDADHILYVDGDCLAVKNLNDIFDELEGSEFAVVGKMHRELDWYGDATSVMRKHGLEEMVQFSGGFIYYERTPGAAQVIEKTLALRDNFDELGLERNGGMVVDEPLISLAMGLAKLGRVVPDTFSFSATPWRAIGKIDLDVIKGICRFPMVVYGEHLFQEPYIYHTAMAKWDLTYWREVRKILQLFAIKEAKDMIPGSSRDIRLKIRRVIVMIARKFWGV